jgi:hypothetical protein
MVSSVRARIMLYKVSSMAASSAFSDMILRTSD